MEKHSSLKDKVGYSEDNLYGLKLTNEPKLRKIRQKERPTASRETLGELRADRDIAISRLGGDDGTQVTLPQIKNYLETELRLIEVNGAPHDVLEIAQRAQDLTNADGKRAALALLQNAYIYFKETIDILKTGQIDEALPEERKNELREFFKSTTSLSQAFAARTFRRNVTALETSIGLLSPRKSSS